MAATFTPFCETDSVRLIRPSHSYSNSDDMVPADTSEQPIRQAFEQTPQKGLKLLFSEYYGPLCSYAVRLGHSPDTACNLVSDLFCIFWQKELYYQITTSYRAYLYAEVRNHILSKPACESSQNPTNVNEAVCFGRITEVYSSENPSVPTENDTVRQPATPTFQNTFSGDQPNLTIANDLHTAFKTVETQFKQLTAPLTRRL